MATWAIDLGWHPIFYPGTPQREFEHYVARVLQVVGDHPIILGVGDMVMRNNLIERCKYYQTLHYQ